MTVLVTRVASTPSLSLQGQGDRIWNSRGFVPPPLSPPHKGEGDAVIAFRDEIIEICAMQRQTKSPSPLWGGARGGGLSAVEAVA
jgi:hypothetical protein